MAEKCNGGDTIINSPTMASNAPTY